jgi:hypothetical protein
VKCGHQSLEDPFASRPTQRPAKKQHLETSIVLSATQLTAASKRLRSRSVGLLRPKFWHGGCPLQKGGLRNLQRRVLRLSDQQTARGTAAVSLLGRRSSLCLP